MSARNASTGVGWIVTIYFCSGLCSLIDEVVWVRLLKLTLGNTVYASSVVVSMFMGGLALGALVMSRFADRVQRRLRLYAILEVCATLSALALPFLLKAADSAYRWFYLKYQPNHTALIIIQVMVSAFILLLPAMVMGSTLPLLGRYLTALRERVGRMVGRLYALNTLGAALGCFLAGFVLIRLAGVMGTLYIAAAINLLVAFGGWRLSRTHDRVEEQPAEVPAAAEPATAAATAPYFLMAAIFCSGLISIGYEIVWMRSIVFLLGGFTYVFSAVLSVYLLGNVIGAAIGSRLSSRLKNPAAAFGISLGCLGICGVLYMAVLSLWLKAPSALIFLSFSEWTEASTALRVIVPLWHCTVLFLVPSVLMGVGFPLALQAWGNYRGRVGRTTGTVYGINTIGAVAGGILAGFVLIPLLGAQLSIIALGLLATAVGALLALLFDPSLGLIRRIAYLAAAAGVLIAAVWLPYDLYVSNAVASAGDPMNVEILEVHEGITTTASVQKDARGRLELTSGRVAVAGDGELRSAQTTLGHLGILLNKRAREVLSIGFGGGETTACMASHGPARIDCVEISPELVDLAVKYFSHINLGDRLHDEVNMIYMDGKNYLHLTPEKYDVIVSGADLPNQSGSAPLFAAEHLRNGLNHLNDHGIFMTKLHIAGLSAESFDSILGTFMDVFPHVTLWFPTTRPLSFLYMVGSAGEQSYSPKYIEAELRKRAVRESVEYLGYETSFDVFIGYVGDREDISRYLKGHRPNTDDMPFVEFSLIPQYRPLREFFTSFTELVRSDSLLEHIDWTGMSRSERDEWLSEYRLYHRVATYILRSHGKADLMDQMVNSADGQSLLPRYAPLVEQERRALAEFRRAATGPNANPDGVLRHVESLLQRRPDVGTAWMVKSWALWGKRDAEGALKAAIEAAKLVPYNPDTHDNLGQMFSKLGMHDEAVEHYRWAVGRIPEDPGLHYNLATLHIWLGETAEAVPLLRKVVELKPDWAKPAQDLAWIIAAHADAEYHDPEEAVRLAERACELSDYRSAAGLDALGVAYAAAGRFPEAVGAIQRALKLVEGTGQASRVEAIQSRLQIFTEGRAYKESTSIASSH
jgi:spermidine synthase